MLFAGNYGKGLTGYDNITLFLSTDGGVTWLSVSISSCDGAAGTAIMGENTGMWVQILSATAGF